MKLEIRQPETPAEWEKYYEIRWKILREPWDQERGNEKDNLEAKAYHLLAKEKKEILGVGRIHLNSTKEAQVRYMAVLPQAQGRGIGAKILKELEEFVKEINIEKIILNAREDAVPFYQRAGYQIIGDGETLFGTIHHKKMQRDFY